MKIQTWQGEVCSIGSSSMPASGGAKRQRAEETNHFVSVLTPYGAVSKMCSSKRHQLLAGSLQSFTGYVNLGKLPKLFIPGKF